MGSFPSRPQTEKYVLVSDTLHTFIRVVDCFPVSFHPGLGLFCGKYSNNDIFYTVSSELVTQTQQARWSLLLATPQRRAGFSSLFTPAGLYMTYVTTLLSHFLSRCTLYQHMLWLWLLYTLRALAACSKDGADPYVSFILLPDKKATTKRRTATKKRDLNPEFNER